MVCAMGGSPEGPAPEESARGPAEDNGGPSAAVGSTGAEGGANAIRLSGAVRGYARCPGMPNGREEGCGQRSGCQSKSSGCGTTNKLSNVPVTYQCFLTWFFHSSKIPPLNGCIGGFLGPCYRWGSGAPGAVFSWGAALVGDGGKCTTVGSPQEEFVSHVCCRAKRSWQPLLSTLPLVVSPCRGHPHFQWRICAVDKGQGGLILVSTHQVLCFPFFLRESADWTLIAGSKQSQIRCNEICSNPCLNFLKNGEARWKERKLATLKYFQNNFLNCYCEVREAYVIALYVTWSL